MFSNTNGRHSLHLVRWAALSIGTMLVLAWTIGFFRHVSESTSTPAHAAMLPKLPKATAKPKPLTSATSAPAQASTMALPAGPVTLPGQPAPAGLMAGHAQIALASAPTSLAPWTALGAAVVSAPTASFETVAPRALAVVAPSAGLIRFRWRGWFDAPVAGNYTLASSISGGQVDKLALRIDGVASPVLTSVRSCGMWDECPQSPTTAAGSVALAEGWHQVEASVTTFAGAQEADVTLYERAPGASTPEVLVPSWPKAGAP